MKIKVGIVGGAGYTGGELIRLLLNHPNVVINFVHSKSSAKKLISSVHQDLIGETDLIFTNKLSFDINLLFLCGNHGDSIKFLNENKINDKINIIDLSQDFRLQTNSTFGKRQFIYGLPELNKSKIKSAKNIANPGCFATAIQLGLLPLAKQGLLNEVYTTGITGSTGAGQTQSATSHFSWRDNNIQAYKTLTHQHVSEINESLSSLHNNICKINFIPWRGNITRGIFVSSQLKCDIDLSELNNIYKNFYKSQPFVSISTDPIFLKQVVNSNKCLIQLEKVGDILVVHSIIDNLLKGASGQAIQNMNLMFGFAESTGLKLKASAF